MAPENATVVFAAVAITSRFSQDGDASPRQVEYELPKILSQSLLWVFHHAFSRAGRLWRPQR